MSLKLIELQIALPRIHESSKIQEQLEQRSQQMQDSVAQKSLKDDELKRTQITKNEENHEMKFEKDQTSSFNHSNHQNKKRSKEKKEEEKIHHPYKGNFIDFSG